MNFNQKRQKQTIDKTNFLKQNLNIDFEILKKMKKLKLINDYFFDQGFVLINGECLSVMESLIKANIVVDHIISDIPYGTINGLTIAGWTKNNTVPSWDHIIDQKTMFAKCFYLSKPNANLILFTQEPLTHQLINTINVFEKYSLSNKMI